MKRVIHLLTLLSGFLLIACSIQTQENPSNFYPIAYKNLQGWDQEDYPVLLSLFRQNCQHIATLPQETDLGGGTGLVGSKAKDWYPVCSAAQRVSGTQPRLIKQFFEQWLQPYQYSMNPIKGKITGYYEPEIAGSLSYTEQYRVPVYTRPKDLVVTKADNGHIHYGRIENNQLVPYYSRAEIDRGALKNKNLEIVWLKSPADLFFMQIQGSGRILLPDGRILRLAYAGKNGQPYTPLGKILIDKGYMDPHDVNIYSLRAWLFNHPRQALSLMEENKNYVFFTAVNAQQLNEGPKGAFGVPLNAGRSVAVDRAWIPLGAPLWLETTLPVPTNQTYKAWNHLVFAHDIGGDIHGINRLDLFTGWGKMAEWYAGLMNEKGKVYLLLPRPLVNSTLNHASSVN